jgi:hypothetical protein
MWNLQVFLIMHQFRNYPVESEPSEESLINNTVTRVQNNEHCILTMFPHMQVGSNWLSGFREDGRFA